MLAKLQHFINQKRLVINDSRLQQEINSFIYKNGRPEAASNKHDDMVMATALSLMALEQYDFIDQNRDRPDPQNAREWVELQLRLGMPKSAILKQGIVRSSGSTTLGSPLPNF